MKMRSRRQIDRDRTKRESRRRARPQDDDAIERDPLDTLEDTVIRALLGYDE